MAATLSPLAPEETFAWLSSDLPDCADNPDYADPKAIEELTPVAQSFPCGNCGGTNRLGWYAEAGDEDYRGGICYVAVCTTCDFAEQL